MRINIKISQINCGNDRRGRPSGCLEFATARKGQKRVGMCRELEFCLRNCYYSDPTNLSVTFKTGMSLKPETSNSTENKILTEAGLSFWLPSGELHESQKN